VVLLLWQKYPKPLRLALAHRKRPVCSGVPRRAFSRRPGANSRIHALKHRALSPPLIDARLGSLMARVARIRAPALNHVCRWYKESISGSCLFPYQFWEFLVLSFEVHFFLCPYSGKSEFRKLLFELIRDLFSNIQVKALK